MARHKLACHRVCWYNCVSIWQAARLRKFAALFAQQPPSPLLIVVAILAHDGHLAAVYHWIPYIVVITCGKYCQFRPTPASSTTYRAARDHECFSLPISPRRHSSCVCQSSVYIAWGFSCAQACGHGQRQRRPVHQLQAISAWQRRRKPWQRVSPACVCGCTAWPHDTGGSPACAPGED